VRAWLASSHGNIVIAASGSSRHAGLVAEISIEDLSGIAVDVEYASEYCYRAERARRDAAVLIVSQSGETADTLAALRKASEAGHETLAITNVEDSTMAREATVSLPTAAGRERAVPATKSFTAQLLNLQLVALLAAEAKGTISEMQLAEDLRQMRGIPAREVGQAFSHANSLLYLGRGVHYAIAREGALKMKESAYLHAEGYPSGELKHGPNALVAEGTPLVMLATVDRTDEGSVLRYEKVVQLMRDMRGQGASILAVGNHGDETVAGLADHVLSVDEVPEALLPICEVIPLQMLAYFMAIHHGIDVDHPRNLTKAVLAE
jgi:glucosamine--fructose-6-phosphate aminotransferase (isomerizing)